MKSQDARDYTKEPVAILNPLSILKMRDMIRLAAYVGDIQFDLVEAMYRNGTSNDRPKLK